MQRKCLLCAIVLVVTMAGCSNLDARKVSLEDRMSGEDKKVKGFRYYVSRPYVVVTGQIQVATTKTRARVVSVAVKDQRYPGDKDGYPYALLAYGFTNGRIVKQLLTLRGNPAPHNWLKVDGEPNLRSASLARDVSLLSQFEPASVKGAHTLTGARVAGRWASLSSGGQQGTPGAGAVGTGGDYTLELRGKPSLEIALAMTQETKMPRGTNDPRPQEGEIKIVYLPDFEEQIAVRNHNFLARSSYKLAFQDGWQLTSVDGTHDATEVAVKVLDTVRRAISVAADVEEKRLNTLPLEAPSIETIPGSRSATEPSEIIVEVTRTLIVEPGMYRLNKSDEMTHDIQTGAGILADMGIPVETQTEIKLVARDG